MVDIIVILLISLPLILIGKTISPDTSINLVLPLNAWMLFV